MALTDNFDALLIRLAARIQKHDPDDPDRTNPRIFVGDLPTKEELRASLIGGDEEQGTDWPSVIDIFLRWKRAPSIVDLSGVSLRGANLRGYNLSGIGVYRRSIVTVILVGTDFSGADLSGADLEGSDCSGADFSGADLSRTRLAGANLIGAKFSDETVLGTTTGVPKCDEVTANLIGQARLKSFLEAAAKALAGNA